MFLFAASSVAASSCSASDSGMTQPTTTGTGGIDGRRDVIPSVRVGEGRGLALLTLDAGDVGKRRSLKADEVVLLGALSVQVRDSDDGDGALALGYSGPRVL